MASLTKKIISDSVLYKLTGGIPHSSFPIHERDIWVALERKINTLFKMRFIDTTLPSGETMPESTMIATYEGIAVTSLGNGKSKATLPVVPITLPKNMGIYLVYDPKYPENPFIPLQRGQLALLRADELLNDLGGQIGYEPNGQTITFTKDLTSFNISSITTELCVLEIATFSSTDPLPIPADYQDFLETELYKEFYAVLPKTGVIDSYTNPTQVPPKGQ